jgi:hypothetical protein
MMRPCHRQRFTVKIGMSNAPSLQLFALLGFEEASHGAGTLHRGNMLLLLLLLR